ncbi:MAG: HDOD domain-containing protein [Rhodothermales bacterium]|nr:HDOD domain-containing protein [Rhodothermales bacterium]MBO6781164.1 HDOD domain-containing protein [Rhodothermales bacterium]
MSVPTRIIFVDDEVNILTSLRRLLRRMRSEWDMAFVEGPEEAIAEMSKAPFDVVVSDMRMPGMSGAELLEITRRENPGVVRIILSGYATQEALLRAVGPAHNFLSKPCDRETLVENIHRSLAVRQRLESPAIRDLILKVDSLPSLPSAYEQLTAAVAAGESDVEVMGRIVRKDIGISTKLLQFVNSSYFGLAESLSDPLEAVRFLGLGTVKGLVASNKLFSQAESSAVGALHQTAYQTAAIVRDLASSVPGVPEDQACLAALTHEAGRLLLAESYPDAYREVVTESENSGRGLSDVEREAFGLTHTEIAGRLLEIWGIPDPVVEAVTFWQTPSESGAQTVTPLALLHTAKALQAEAQGASFLPDCEYLDRVGLAGRLASWKREFLPRLGHAA